MAPETIATLVFGTFDALPQREPLVLIDDCEPQALRMLFEEQRRGRFRWASAKRTDSSWRTTVWHARSSSPVENADATVIAFLRRCALLHGLTGHTISQLATSAVDRTYSRGDMIASQRCDWPYLGFVREGLVRVLRTDRYNRKRLLHRLGPFEAGGLASALQGGPPAGSILAASRSVRLVLVPRRTIWETMRASPLAFEAVARSCVRALYDLIRRFEVYLDSNTLSRVAYALLPYASSEPGMAPALPMARMLSQEELAVDAGTVQEIVGRMLSLLERKEVIEIERGRVVRINHDRLIDMAGA